MSKRHGPLVIGVTDPLRHPGSRYPVALTAALADLAISTAAVPSGAEVALEVAVEAMADGRLTVTGTVVAPYEAACRRCLEPVAGRVEARVKEVFEGVPVEGETYPRHGEQIDLEQLARDAVLLALPLAPLCRDDCAGPDPLDHPVTVADGDGPVEGDDGHEAPPTDPRWAALRELRFD